MGIKSGLPVAKKGCVYLVQAGEMHRFKIGRAIDPKKRIRSLQTSSPFPLRLIGWKKCADMFAEEKRWHLLFRESRKNGEWFDLSHTQLVKIATRLKAELGIHYEKRSTPKLVAGRRFFISFNGRKVREVELLAMPGEGEESATVRGVKCGTTWNLFPDEIRETEIDALINHVTF